MDIGVADTSIRPPLSHFYTFKKECIQNIVNRAWTSMEGCRVPRAIWPELTVAITKRMLGLKMEHYPQSIYLHDATV